MPEMTKEEFVADPGSWWLLEEYPVHSVDARRKALGASFGWTDLTWYTQERNLTEVYELVKETQLFRELDQATDEEKRTRWLASVIKLKTPVESEQPMAAASPPTAAAGAAARTAATPTQPARRSAFGPRTESATDAGASGGGTAALATAPTSAQPGRRSAFAPRAETPPEPSVAAAGSAPASADSELTEEQVEEVQEEIQTVMSELSVDNLSEIAEELGISPDEVSEMMRDPEFARMVAEERARMGVG